MPDPATFFTDTEKQELVRTIRTAEKLTSGEIRLHVEERCKGDAFQRGLQVFAQLKMHRTAARNGVLFYLATADRKFSIVADEGINNMVSEGFWNEIKDTMQAKFQQGEFMLGLALGIERAGQQLQLHFPYQRDDENELPDEISFG
ncbi:MAG: TPM domain-containing protein [Chitinophagales bacterium]|nr:TPM domain-containing protein [Chitinophagales bacterium]HAE34703.1 hypothetical protein [Bacteroidota bacterium]MCB9018739.1 TPM domain-containing protein [Chitinophagales bacterium]MCB9020970.1 TPM domain-containing protein [Chitinophagales bacterium]HPR29669.1 TPM domain-containing protein [Chitinophagales bacterium]